MPPDLGPHEREEPVPAAADRFQEVHADQLLQDPAGLRSRHPEQGRHRGNVQRVAVAQAICRHATASSVASLLIAHSNPRAAVQSSSSTAGDAKSPRICWCTSCTVSRGLASSRAAEIRTASGCAEHSATIPSAASGSARRRS